MNSADAHDADDADDDASVDDDDTDDADDALLDEVDGPGFNSIPTRRSAADVVTEGT